MSNFKFSCIFHVIIFHLSELQSTFKFLNMNSAIKPLVGSLSFLSPLNYFVLK